MFEMSKCCLIFMKLKKKNHNIFNTTNEHRE
jgi:hypothetical protein